MQTIANVQTLATYDDTLTLGPDAFEAISVQVWNATVLMQTWNAPAGQYVQGQWIDETLVAPSTLTLARCGGVRFKTNPSTPATPGRIIAFAYKAGEPVVVGGIQLSGTLASSGGVSGGGAVITGLIPAAGTTPTAGTGFTYTHVNGSGSYVFTFTTAFSATPDIVCTIQGASNGFLRITAQSANGFTVQTTDTAGAAADRAFNFTATPVT